MQPTKRLLLASLAASAVLGSLAGCSDNGSAPSADSSKASSEASASADLLARIKERGTITIAMEGTWSPWTYHDKDGNLTGYDVEIGRRIAQKIGVKAEFIEGKWDGLLAGLDAGRYDLMINGVGVTPERERAYNFSKPYAYDRVAVIVNADQNNITRIDDLKGKTTANTISSTYAETAEKYGAKVIGVDDLNQTFELLRARRIDATLNSEVTFVDYTKAHPDAAIKIAVFVPEQGLVAIPLKKDPSTDSLRALINETIDELRASGELSKISQRFFGLDISSEK